MAKRAVFAMLALPLPQGPLAVGAQKGVELSDQKTRIQVRKGELRTRIERNWDQRPGAGKQMECEV